MSPTEQFLNPKMERRTSVRMESLHPYYAGFSSAFVADVLQSQHLHASSIVLDPWNGSGTTTSVAASMSYASIGIDMNPVMVLTARARMLEPAEVTELSSVLSRIPACMERSTTADGIDDPLGAWFRHGSCRAFRLIEHAIQRLTMSNSRHGFLNTAERLSLVDAKAAFLYTGLFHTIRRFLGPFLATNPTWTKLPKDDSEKLEPDFASIFTGFQDQCQGMLALESGLRNSLAVECSTPTIIVGDSANIPLRDGSVNFVLSSPPYCTRIDYAIATLPELAVLGYRSDGDAQLLRRRLMGTPTVPKICSPVQSEWGDTCCKLLTGIKAHPSKASATYYYKGHVQYFDHMFRSLKEIFRVLRPGANCILVVQDSYYKNIHNDLPSIVCQMATGVGAALTQRTDFPAKTLMSWRHPGVRQYRSHQSAIESVLLFVRCK